MLLPKKRNRNNRRFVAALAICLGLLTSCGQAVPSRSDRQDFWHQSAKQDVQPERETVYNDGVVRNPDYDSELTPEMQSAVLEFMDTWYLAVANLEERDLSYLFDEDALLGRESLAQNQLVLSYLVETRNQNANDLTMADYSYGVTFWRFETLEDGTVLVAFIEDSKVNFSFMRDIDSTHVGYHTMLLTGDETGYKVGYHLDRQDINLAIAQRYEEMKKEQGLGKSNMTDIYRNRLLSEIRDTLYQETEERSALTQETAAEPLSPEPVYNSYDRAAAVDYALSWVGEKEELRNDAFQNYEMMGGDCNNFVSQCIYAGGVPMDTKGEVQWKWFGDNVNLTNTASGRTPAWAGVNEFYAYCIQWDDHGIVTQPDAGLEAAQLGDVLQMGVLGEWRHSVMVTGLVENPDGGAPLDLLVSAHSADRKNYPVSAYLFPNIRLIKILGWNDGETAQ